MPLPNDITLDGVDYALVPGGYRKRNAPATAATNPRDVRRLTLGPFGRGQRQALARSTFDFRLTRHSSPPAGTRSASRRASTGRGSSRSRRSSRSATR